MSQDPVSQNISEVLPVSKTDSSMCLVLSTQHGSEKRGVVSETSLSDQSQSSSELDVRPNHNDHRDKKGTLTEILPLETRFHNVVNIITGYVLDVLAGAFRLMKAPLSLLIYFFLLFAMGTALYLGLREPTTRLVCQIPGASLLINCHAFPQVPNIESNVTIRADYPSLMALQNDALDRLLMQSSAGSQLAFDVKRAEVLVRGLTSYVKHSRLDNKVLIASLLSQFAADAKDTGRDLQKLSSKLFGAVASVTAFAEHAEFTISDTRGSGTKDISPVVQRMFKASIEVLSDQVVRVSTHAAHSIARLDGLEGRMEMIHDALVKEDLLVIEYRSRLVADVWTRLGWNTCQLRLVDTHLKLLSNVQDYRLQALNHVIGTMQTLEAIDTDLVELRSQLSTPEVAVIELIPMDVQLASIRDSIHRLRQQMEVAPRGDEQVTWIGQHMRDVMLGTSADDKRSGEEQ